VFLCILCGEKKQTRMSVLHFNIGIPACGYYNWAMQSKNRYVKLKELAGFNLSSGKQAIIKIVFID